MKFNLMNKKGLSAFIVDTITLFLFLFIFIALFYIAKDNGSQHIQKIESILEYKDTELLSLSLLNYPLENNNLNEDETFSEFFSSMGYYLNYNKQGILELDDSYEKILNESLAIFSGHSLRQRFSLLVLREGYSDKLLDLYDDARKGKVSNNPDIFYFYQKNPLENHDDEFKEFVNEGEQNSTVRQLEIPVVIDNKKTNILIFINSDNKASTQTSTTQTSSNP